MNKISKELIESYRKIVLPYVSKRLYKADFEGQGETDKTEFEQDFNKILDLAIKALEERPQGEWVGDTDYNKGFRDGYAQCITDNEDRKERNRLFEQKGGAEDD